MRTAEQIADTLLESTVLAGSVINRGIKGRISNALANYASEREKPLREALENLVKWAKTHRCQNERGNAADWCGMSDAVEIAEKALEGK